MGQLFLQLARCVAVAVFSLSLKNICKIKTEVPRFIQRIIFGNMNMNANLNENSRRRKNRAIFV